MKNKHNIQWRCGICKIPIATLHEIFYGKFRQKSIEYSLQIPLCMDCHNFAHLKKNMQTYTHDQFVITCKYSHEEKLNYIIQDYFCEIMKLPCRHIIKQALEKGDNKYLELLRPIGELAIKKLEI